MARTDPPFDFLRDMNPLQTYGEQAKVLVAARRREGHNLKDLLAEVVAALEIHDGRSLRLLGHPGYEDCRRIWEWYRMLKSELTTQIFFAQQGHVER
ncbi:hypothetical protein SUNI508_04493 [Seiridium unicorne]|uniref:Uncharacterized protein n=1 Tax=Seiridium unicorne TaxID=138068 RepID=A0ABR2V8F7_9PEZI